MPENHPVLEEVPMKSLSSSNLEKILEEEGAKIIFLWGYNCPNCDVAKSSLYEELETVRALPVQWYHCNVYEDFDVATRFGLHGIPVFLLYQGPRSRGKITSYPGFDSFLDIIKTRLLEIPA